MSNESGSKFEEPEEVRARAFDLLNTHGIKVDANEVRLRDYSELAPTSEGLFALVNDGGTRAQTTLWEQHKSGLELPPRMRELELIVDEQNVLVRDSYFQR